MMQKEKSVSLISSPRANALRDGKRLRRDQESRFPVGLGLTVGGILAIVFSDRSARCFAFFERCSSCLHAPLPVTLSY